MAGIPIIVILMPLYSVKIQQNIRNQLSRLGAAARVVTTTVDAIGTVKSCNGENIQQHQYTSAIEKAGHYLDRQSFWNALQASTIRFATLAMFVQGFWFSSSLLDSGKITPSEIMTSFWAAVQGLQALVQINPYLGVLENGRGAAHLLQTMLIPSQTETAKVQLSLSKPHTCAGDIRFQNVCWKDESILCTRLKIPGVIRISNKTYE